MRVETIYNPDGTTKQHYIADPGETLVLTGPVTGLLTREDGTPVDVTPDYVAVTTPEAEAELFGLIAQVHLDNGHPHDVDHLVDPETGQTVPVQRPFVYVNPDGDVAVGVGVAHGEHPLDECNGVVCSDADPRIAQSKES